MQTLHTHPFLLQLGHPQIKPIEDSVFENVNEVFPKLFRENEEAAYIFWQEIPIRISYRFGLFKNINEIIALLWLMSQQDQGATQINLRTEQIGCDLEVRWTETEVSLRGNFFPIVDSVRKMCIALKKRRDIHLPKEDFLREWKPLGLQVLKAFQAANIEITAPKEQQKLIWLREALEDIPALGRIYSLDTQV